MKIAILILMASITAVGQTPAAKAPQAVDDPQSLRGNSVYTSTTMLVARDICSDHSADTKVWILDYRTKTWLNPTCEEWTQTDSGTKVDTTQPLRGNDSGRWYPMSAVTDRETSLLIQVNADNDEATLCATFRRKDGLVHSVILGREYVQTCAEGRLGPLVPKDDDTQWAKIDSAHIVLDSVQAKEQDQPVPVCTSESTTTCVDPSLTLFQTAPHQSLYCDKVGFNPDECIHLNGAGDRDFQAAPYGQVPQTLLRAEPPKPYTVIEPVTQPVLHCPDGWRVEEWHEAAPAPQYGPDWGIMSDKSEYRPYSKPIEITVGIEDPKHPPKCVRDVPSNQRMK